MAGIKGIDSTPSRISSNFTTPKLTTQRSFGESLASGISAAGNMVSQGASLLGGSMGGGLISSAVSSVSTLAQGNGAMAASYAATGTSPAVPVGAGVGSVGLTGGLNAGGTGSTGVNLTAGTGTANAVGDQSSLTEFARMNREMLNTQVVMQRENNHFTSMSNVLKTRHDTSKNSISNMR